MRGVEVTLRNIKEELRTMIIEDHGVYLEDDDIREYLESFMKNHRDQIAAHRRAEYGE